MTHRQLSEKTGPYKNYYQALVDFGFISPQELVVVQQERQRTQNKFIDILLECGFVSPRDLKFFFIEHFGHQDFTQFTLENNPRDLQGISETQAYKILEVAPLKFDGSRLDLVCVNPQDLKSFDGILERFKGVQEVVCWVATKAELYTYLSEVALVGCDDTSMEDPPSVVQRFLFQAVEGGISDIHFEPHKTYVQIRFRQDGVLKDHTLFHLAQWPGILNRLKVISGMNIAETTRPQVGRFSFPYQGRRIDFRCSSLPVSEGENFVVRLLDKFQNLLSLDRLGFSEAQQEILKKQGARNSGIILMTGPTGSGKTTTLYALLQSMDHKSRNIMTLEDPIEYDIPGIRQCQIDETYGLGFTEGVRSILRQDPDVILIGEIRDEGTAKMAIRAAMTGHLVLATLHANDALSATQRFMDLGVDYSLLSGLINCVISQRLLRIPCPTCQGGQEGCTKCNEGYKGRRCVAEILDVTLEMDAMLLSGQPRRKLLDYAVAQGFISMKDNAQDLVAQGVIDLKEVTRVLA